jgi:hypothetical protein
MARYKKIKGRLTRYSRALRTDFKDTARRLRRRHGIRKGGSWIRKHWHTLSRTLVNRIRGHGHYGKWKKHGGNRSRLRKNVKHGKHRFLHTWTPRQGLRIRKVGKGAGRGFISRSHYKRLKHKHQHKKRRS